MLFDPVAKVLELSDEPQDIPLQRFFFRKLYLSDSIFFKNRLD